MLSHHHLRQIFDLAVLRSCRLSVAARPLVRAAAVEFSRSSLRSR